MVQKGYKILILVMLVGLSFFVGYRLAKKPIVIVDENCYGDLSKYINPKLDCSSELIVDKRNYTAFKTKLANFIKSKKDSGEISLVSVYFRDMQNGPTLGIDEYADYAPASLLKLPLLLAYYKFEETNPGTLDIQVEFDSQQSAPDDLVQQIPTKNPVQPNTPYKIRELLDHMIKYSDNQAYYVLVNYLSQLTPNQELLKQTYLDLGIVAPEQIFQQTISVKAYSSIFLQLYNSSFFDKNSTSESALQLLTETDFSNGIQAGVPNNIKVAHKFGEREGFADGTRQLHDCGIVYYPKNPYLLCIMTQGKNINSLQQVIKEISQQFYEEFSSRAN